MFNNIITQNSVQCDSQYLLERRWQMNIRRLAAVTGFAKGFAMVEDLRGCFM